MSVRSIRAAWAAAAWSIGAAAHADFHGALEEYNAGHYEAAHAQFLSLAELGDCSSQFNLGAMDLLAGAPSAAQAAQVHALLEQASGSDGFYVGKHVAALLASSPLEAVRDAATALKVALRLAAGDIQSDPQLFETVAAAYAASGDFRNAAASERIAIRKAEALAWNTRPMKERLSEYHADRPWHGDLLAWPPAGRLAAH